MVQYGKNLMLAVAGTAILAGCGAFGDACARLLAACGAPCADEPNK